MDTPPLSDFEARRMAMFCHLLAFTGYVTGIGLVLAPLALWLVQRKRSAFVDDQGRESIQFQLNVVILAAIAYLVLPSGMGALLLLILGFAHFFLTLVASAKAQQGQDYRYPFSPRWLPR